uniref:PH domain-containing protein n=1 Tax=Macrostomum lignano TaxID=282301 RepID=A0A1I8FJE0_9PLAT
MEQDKPEVEDQQEWRAVALNEVESRLASLETRTPASRSSLQTPGRGAPRLAQAAAETLNRRQAAATGSAGVRRPGIVSTRRVDVRR